MTNPIFNSTLEDSFKELSKAFKLINTHALESVKQEYMSVLNKAYIEVSSGVYDYNTAIKRALKGMADNGITGATYRRAGKIVNYSIEAAVRRETMTAVHQAANRNSYKLAEELGTGYVEVSSHAGARTHPTNHIANHAWWQGKVYKIEVKFSTGAACCVVLASDGYPKKYASGFEMTLPEVAEGEHLFVAGAKLEDGKLLSAGGRVIGAVATDKDLASAVKHAYEVAEKVQFENKYCRKDIGKRALAAK